MKTQALKGMRDLLPAEQALRDYIRIIQEEYQKRSGAGLDPLAAATEKYTAQLGHGGKQHG